MDYEAVQQISRRVSVLDHGVHCPRRAAPAGESHQSAFAQYYATNFVRIVSLLRKQGWSREASEDAIHEVIKRLMQKPCLLDNVRDFGAFLIVSSRHNLLNENRRYKRFVRCRDSISLVWQISPCESGRKSDREEDLDAKIRCILENLSPKTKQVLEFRLFHGMTLHSISSELAIPYGTVAAIWRRFLQKSTRAGDRSSCRI